ncbi:cytochrome P450 [Streptomyces thinghirensis]|uniref:Cytochrome P450 n=2 Tax=Streptomyces thinghirensis TaxID=551547 RepID=A0ABP9TE18_9ACTN
MSECPMNKRPDPLAYPFQDSERLEVDPAYARLRAGEGLGRVRPPFGDPGWLAARHEDVRAVLADTRFSRARALGDDAPRLVPFLPPPDTIMAMDPPEHNRLRKMLAQAFTMRRVEKLRPRVQHIVDEQIDALEKAGNEGDLMRSFAVPVSLTVITELLGVPYEERDRFGGWVGVIFSPDHPPEAAMKANEDLMGYLAGLVARRREQPGEDLLSVLVEARDAGDRLTESEMVGLAAAVLIAGFDVTSNNLGNQLYALLSSPSHLRQLRDDPALVPQAVEEMLRYIRPGTGESIPRVAAEDVELGGALIKAGEAVLPSLMSANRDAAVFENPDTMDFTRTHNPHLAFGHGPHHCVGAQLARLELQLAIETLLRRLPGLRLAVPADEVPWLPPQAVWSAPVNLPATW